MKNTIETIKTSKDGSKLLKFNGTEFWVNPFNHISQTNNWEVTNELVAAGLATRKTYRNAYGHTQYTIK